MLGFPSAKSKGTLTFGRSDLDNGARIEDIGILLAVSDRAVQRWTKDARKSEKEAQQAKAWELWLECRDVRKIAEAIGVPKSTIDDWVSEKRQMSEFGQPPGATAKNEWGNVQHFDIWQFASADKDTQFDSLASGEASNTGASHRQLSTGARFTLSALKVHAERPKNGAPQGLAIPACTEGEQFTLSIR